MKSKLQAPYRISRFDERIKRRTRCVYNWQRYCHHSPGAKDGGGGERRGQDDIATCPRGSNSEPGYRLAGATASEGPNHRPAQPHKAFLSTPPSNSRKNIIDRKGLQLPDLACQTLPDVVIVRDSSEAVFRIRIEFEVIVWFCRESPCEHACSLSHSLSLFDDGC